MSNQAMVVLPDPVSVEVIRDDLWAAGGELIFIPFTSGANTEAGAVVDRISLMIVKGTADVLTEKPGVFKYIFDGDAENARFVLEGRIEEFDTASRWRWIGIGKKKGTLKVKGEVRDRLSGALVAMISGVKTFVNVKDSELAAYGLGRVIGEKVRH